MKKSNRIISLTSAAALSCALLSSVCANSAIFTAHTEELDKYLKGYTKLDGCEAFSYREYPPEYSEYYADDKGNITAVIKNRPSFISLSIPIGIDYGDLRATIKEICPNSITTIYTNNLELKNIGCAACSIYSYEGYATDEEHSALNITEAQARQIYEALKEKDYVRSFEFSGNRCSMLHGYCYSPSNYQLMNDEIEALKTYIAENELEFTVEVDPEEIVYSFMGRDMIFYNTSLIPDNEMATIEIFNFANQVARDLGFRPYPTVYLMSDTTISTSIDIFNSVDGDANEDGELNMADAVFIMQAMANPDKYSLTAQGSFNADISNTGDGITVKDALAIQQRLLGIEE